MSDGSIVILAAFMGMVTYPTRVMAFLVPIDRLPTWAGRYLQLMGPATLAALAAISVVDPGSGPGGVLAAQPPTLAAAAACMALVAVRRSLVPGIIGAVVVGLALGSG